MIKMLAHIQMKNIDGNFSNSLDVKELTKITVVYEQMVEITYTSDKLEELDIIPNRTYNFEGELKVSILGSDIKYVSFTS
ncbi:hypothetical protein ACPBEI_11590 [Latilactobacillus sakei]